MRFLLVPVFMFVTHFGFCQSNDFLTVVYNNIPSQNHLKTDWGYAAWIEIGEEVVLFDTGAKADLLQENFKKLNLDLSKISAIAISHEHYDHTGGLESVLKQLQKGTIVYLPNDYKPSLRNQFNEIEFVVNDKYKKIAKGVWLSKIFIDSNRGIREQAIILVKGKKAIVITGCAHPGIVKMCEGIRKQFPNKTLQLLTGGFHLMRTQKEDVAQMSNQIRQLGFQYVAPSHCTGDSSIALFKKDWGDNFVQLNLGDSYWF